MTTEWQAVIADNYGYIFAATHLRWPDGRLHPSSETTTATVRESDCREVTVSIVRGAAAPIGGDGGWNRLPGTYRSGDVAHTEDIELDHGDDDSVSLETRWAQAQAMAAGLNNAMAEQGSDQIDAIGENS